LTTFSESNLGIILGLGLGSNAVGRAPQVHRRVRDIGSPEEEDGVDVVDGQSATRIDPIHVPVAARHEAIQTKQKEDRPASHISRNPGRHVR